MLPPAVSAVLCCEPTLIAAPALLLPASLIALCTLWALDLLLRQWLAVDQALCVACGAAHFRGASEVVELPGADITDPL